MMSPIQHHLNTDAPLLTREQEQRLSRDVQAGLAAQALLDSGDRLSARQRREANRIAQSGNVARHRFVESNIRLVHYIANNYLNRGLDMDDLMQEGTIGLMHAIRKFDPSLGYRFSTYAVPWIKQSITRAVGNTTRNIRLPENQLVNLARLASANHTFVEETGRVPAVSELVEATGLSAQQILALRPHLGGTISLYTPLGDECGADLIDLFESEEPAPDKVVEENEQVQAVRLLLDLLSEKERLVVSKRFGLIGEPATLATVAKEMKVSRERIRQIEARALAKMRHPAMAKQLR